MRKDSHLLIPKFYFWKSTYKTIIMEYGRKSEFLKELENMASQMSKKSKKKKSDDGDMRE